MTRILAYLKSNQSFSQFVSSDDISKTITSLDSTKKTSGVIQTKIIKLANKEICKDIAKYIYESIKKNEFPNELKAADITPTFKKEDPPNKENYRPVSVLPTISKIFERVLFDQFTKFSNKFPSPLLCGFRKGYGTQYALVNLLQIWKKSLDEPDAIVGTFLMDLSKTHDCVNHELSIAKLAAYGLNEGSPRLIQNSLSKRKQWFFPE